MTAPPVLTAERIDAMLSVMAEVCLESVVEAGQRQKAAEDFEAFERSGRTLQRACRNLRQTIAMKQRFDREELQKACEARKAAETARLDTERTHERAVARRRNQVSAHFSRVLWNEYEADDSAELLDEVETRLRDLAFDDDFLETPLDTLIQRLADDIGLGGPDEAPEPPLEAAPPLAPSSGRGGRRDHAEDAERTGIPDPSASSADVSAISAVESEAAAIPAPAVDPPPDPPPPPEPYVPPWERLRPGEVMPGGSGY